MHFHANYVSTSVFGNGDYYQATFEVEQDADDPGSAYLLIQRQFEDPDDNWCYIPIWLKQAPQLLREGVGHGRHRPAYHRL